MRQDIRDALELIYRDFTTEQLRTMFATGSADPLFIQIATDALGREKADGAKISALVWLGYEIAVDSRYLPLHWR